MVAPGTPGFSPSLSFKILSEAPEQVLCCVFLLPKFYRCAPAPGRGPRRKWDPLTFAIARSHLLGCRPLSAALCTLGLPHVPPSGPAAAGKSWTSSPLPRDEAQGLVIRGSAQGASPRARLEETELGAERSTIQESGRGWTASGCEFRLGAGSWPGPRFPRRAVSALHVIHCCREEGAWLGENC